MAREPVKPPNVDVRRDVTISIPRTFVSEAVVSWAIRNGHMPAGQMRVSVNFVCDDCGDRPTLSEAVITYREETTDAG